MAFPIIWFGWPVVRSILAFESFFPGIVTNLLVLGAIGVADYFWLGHVPRPFEVWTDRLVMKQGRERSKEIPYGSIKSVKKGSAIAMPRGIITLPGDFARFATAMGTGVIVYFDDYKAMRPTPTDPDLLFNILQDALSEYRKERAIQV